MGGKILAALVGLLSLACAAFIMVKIVTLYGAARYAAGRAEAEAAQLPRIVAAHDAAARAGLTARDRIIAADASRMAEMARILPHILTAYDKVNAYASTVAGGAPCLAAERVRGIESDRAALFPDLSETDIGDPRSMPPGAAADTAGP
ncbi:hypothetical protein ACSBM8_00600 [Sphingomonas sp. ASY06-1R]|uniref:hypothetical protein n=1 Tax=Sphingomonas sp. ASY06-1R TaxID=3445771 RepID=UPI003FA26427